jgi:hypothetical protein
MKRTAEVPAEPPLLAAVRDALSGVLDVRAYLHPARPGAVAVRGAFWRACAVVLEKAGYRVEQEDGWLTVRAG